MTNNTPFHQKHDDKYWNSLYEEIGEAEVPWVKSNFIQEHLDFFKSFKGKEALCIADGTGDNGIELAKMGIHVTATDISTTAIDLATKRAKKENLTNYKVINTGTLEYDFGKKFDLILGIKIQFTEDYTTLHHQMMKLINKNGFIAILGFHPEHLKLKERGPPNKELLYSSDDLKSDFKGMKVIESLDFIFEFKEENINRKQHLVSFICQNE
jgi:ubiquinone/menaquinone biosynthesis C-methylase UbiE